MRRVSHSPQQIILFAFGLCLAASVIFFGVTEAAPIKQEPPPDPKLESAYGDAPVQLSIDNQVCLSCHGQPGLNMTLGNGEVWDLFVPEEAHQNSVHGQSGYACVQCHTQVGDYPHPPFSANDARDASLKLYNACIRCHAFQYEAGQDSAHSIAQSSGNREAAICTDCHTAHDVRRIYEPQTRDMLFDARVWIPQTCARCHSTIYEKYKESVHGAALIGEGNPDVPTCTDCHGSHTIQDPTTSAFRLKSPDICAKCHTDPEIMSNYGISTDVLDTYVSDFHGTSLLLFQPQSPDAPFNKPVCTDCHGVHDIASKDNPEKSLQVRENLLARCQVCHPDASENFPASWLSHYIPSPEQYPIVYYIDLFYKFFIPVTLGGMGILVALDLSRLSINRWRKRNPEIEVDEEPVESSVKSNQSQSEDLPEEPGQSTGLLMDEESKQLPINQTDPVNDLESDATEVQNSTQSMNDITSEDFPDDKNDIDHEAPSDTEAK